MRSSLPSSAAWLENYSKSYIKRCYLFSYLMSDLASLFKFSWFLCLVVLTMGIVPGRGCHDSQTPPPFQPPWKVAFYSRNAQRKGWILDKRYLLNISWMLLGSAASCDPLVKVCEGARTEKEKTWKAMLVRVLSLFSLLLSFHCWEMADYADFLI